MPDPLRPDSQKSYPQWQLRSADQTLQWKKRHMEDCLMESVQVNWLS